MLRKARNIGLLVVVLLVLTTLVASAVYYPLVWDSRLGAMGIEYTHLDDFTSDIWRGWAVLDGNWYDVPRLVRFFMYDEWLHQEECIFVKEYNEDWTVNQNAQFTLQCSEGNFTLEPVHDGWSGTHLNEIMFARIGGPPCYIKPVNGDLMAPLPDLTDTGDSIYFHWHINLD